MPTHIFIADIVPAVFREEQQQNETSCQKCCGGCRRLIWPKIYCSCIALKLLVACRGPLEALLAALGPLLGTFRLLLAALGPLWAALGPLLAAPGPRLAALGSLLAILGRSSFALGCSWLVLGRSWAGLGPLLGALGLPLAALESLLGRSWAPKMRPKMPFEPLFC